MIRLNLLPPEMKQDIAYAKRNASLYQLLINLVGGFIIMAIIIGVIGYIVYTNEQLAQDEKNVAEAQLASWNSTERDASDFANRLNLVDKLRTDKIDWNLVFAELAKSTPANVKLASYDFTNNKTDRVGLTGFAVTNTDIGTFREILSKSKLFQYVDIENVAASTDPADSTKNVLSFKITMNLNQAEAKK